MAEGDALSVEASLDGSGSPSDAAAAVSSVSCLWPKAEHSRGAAPSRNLVPATAILFSLNDFKFLCAKYVSAQEQRENVDRVLCSSLDDIISQCHLMWAVGRRRLIESGLRPALAAALTRTAGSSNHYSFKDSWTKCIFAAEGEDYKSSDDAEGSGGGGSDFMMIPSAPSAAMRGALRGITRHVHEKIYSVDTFQIYCGAAGGISCLARHVCSQLIAECLAVVSRCYREALDHYLSSSSGGDKSFLSSPEGAPDDAVAMQLVFDLSSLLSVLEGPGQPSEEGVLEVERCVAACKEAMDPVTAHLGLPLIQGKVQEFCRARRLIYNMSILGDNVTRSNSGSGSTVQVKSRSYFAGGAANETKDSSAKVDSSAQNRQQRFSLLPVPSMTSAGFTSSAGKQGSKSSSSDSSQSQSTSTSSGDRRSAGSSAAPAGGAAKFLRGAAASTAAQGVLEGLGVGFNFLTGGRTAATDGGGAQAGANASPPQAPHSSK